ncbi:MAG: thiamine phosphate synthase [Akkermansiaceae bacterium]|nr:thiamine phosphate synthase [Akkermansiaceae bacterium]
MKKILADCRLYGIVDMGYTKPEQVLPRTLALIEGGVHIIQLRAKGVELPLVKKWAIAMQAMCRAHRAVFVLNDYPEMAAEIGADAVHVGQDGGSLEGVRKIVGPGVLVGRSTHSPQQALQAREEGADYIGFGPLFPTGTKPGRPSIGLQDIAATQQHMGDMPMFCIGGINATTLPQVLQAGAKRVVIVSWLLQQADIAAAARKVISMLEP